MKNVFNSLNQTYYFIYTLIILMAISGYLLNLNNIITVNISHSVTITLLIVHGVLAFLAVAYYLYFLILKNKIKLIANIHDREKTYLKAGKIRLALIGISLFFGVICLFIIRAEIPLYFIAISGILLLICKPVEAKIEELLSDN